MAVLSQQARFAIGVKKQVDLVTASDQADLVSLQLTNTDPIQVQPINEDNKQDLGKGVYATKTYKSHIQSGGAFNGRMTSEAVALILAFWHSKRTKAATTATGGFKYTMVAPQLQTDGLDLQATTIITALGDASDKALVGACCEEVGLEFRSGTGRDNALFTSQWTGTGKHIKPATSGGSPPYTMPAAYTEHGLNAGGISALTLLGFDYLANKRFSQVSVGLKNNIRPGFFPGSGNQSGYQLQGRMRRGVPEITVRAQVEIDSGSSEEDALLAQTEGTGVITCLGDQIAAGPESHQFKITLHRIVVKVTPIADNDGIASYNLEYSVLEHASNGVWTIEAITTLDNILS